jgi:hypothetical protein
MTDCMEDFMQTAVEINSRLQKVRWRCSPWLRSTIFFSTLCLSTTLYLSVQGPTSSQHALLDLHCQTSPIVSFAHSFDCVGCQHPRSLKLQRAHITTTSDEPTNITIPAEEEEEDDDWDFVPFCLSIATHCSKKLSSYNLEYLHLDNF